MNQRLNIVVTYLVYYVDEGLSVAPLEKLDNICRFHVGDDRLNGRRKLILEDRAVDQALQGSFERVESKGWFREVVRIL